MAEPTTASSERVTMEELIDRLDDFQADCEAEAALAADHGEDDDEDEKIDIDGVLGPGMEEEMERALKDLRQKVDDIGALTIAKEHQPDVNLTRDLKAELVKAKAEADRMTNWMGEVSKDLLQEEEDLMQRPPYLIAEYPKFAGSDEGETEKSGMENGKMMLKVNEPIQLTDRTSFQVDVHATRKYCNVMLYRYDWNDLSRNTPASDDDAKWREAFVFDEDYVVRHVVAAGEKFRCVTGNWAEPTLGELFDIVFPE